MVVSALACASAQSAPLFPDLTADWAVEAVKVLHIKSLVHGYPDGLFRGDRAPTRYEMAAIISTVLSRLRAEDAGFASKPEVQALEAAAQHYNYEFDAIGVRLLPLESAQRLLDERVSQRERIAFYGSFQANSTSNTLAGPLGIGTSLHNALDYTNGRLLFAGTGVTTRALLGVDARLSPQLEAGLEVSSYTATGQSAIEQYWGVTPPYFSNPFLAQATPLPKMIGTDSNTPQTRMSFDRFWLRDEQHNTQLVLGTFATRLVSDTVVAGIRNPNVHAPALLPFFGFQLVPLQQEGSRWSYEVAYAKLPSNGAYDSSLWTAAASYKLGSVKLAATVARAGSEAVTDGVSVGTGGVILPVASGTQLKWQDARTGMLHNSVGAQGQFIWGADVEADIVPKQLAAHAHYARSTYNPDTSGQLFMTHAGGSLLDLGLKATHGAWSAELDYIAVDPTYDVMMLPYALNPSFPLLLPYGSWYSSHYQLHDYLKYPNNRAGERLNLTWTGANDQVMANVENLRQVRATTAAQLSTPGNTEPLFPLLTTPGVSAAGTSLSWTLGYAHRFGHGYRAVATYSDYKLRRATVLADDVDLGERMARLEVGKTFNDSLDLAVGYTTLDLLGHTGLINNSFEQHLPSARLTWTPAANVSVGVEQRLLWYRDRLVTGSSWHGNQSVIDIRYNF
jgi:hypothetical protein